LAFASGAWELSLASGESRAQVSLALADGAGLSPPLVSLAAGGGSLAWDAVAGAAAYECRVAFSGSTVRAETAATPGCAVGDLPDGGYAARITAFSADLGAVGADLAQSPALPTRFDMSEGRLSFLRAGADPVTVVTAAGGAMDAGLGSRTLAIWLSIRRDGGAPTPEAWTITVTGPDLPPSSPIVFTYPANFSQLLRWSYDQPATIGRYTLVATSAAGTVEAEFSVGLPAELSLPAGVTATDGAQGSARVDWTPVAGARSYLVGVWQGAEFVTSQWVAAPPANFPQDTFVAGQLYDVYVAASDADMVSGARSTQVAVVENTLQPAGFVAR
jgi:hypothetical protein